MGAAQLTPGVRRVLRLVGVGAFGAVAALIALSFVPPTKADLGPGTVSLEARCCLGGDTTLLLPPVGSISAETHRSSLALDARVEQVDVERLQALTSSDAPEQELVGEIQHDLPGLLRRFVAKLMVVGLVVGAAAAMVLPGRRASFALAGGAGGLVITAAALALVWTSFDEQAFAEPRFTGPVAEAPRVIEAATAYVDDFGDVQDRVEVLGAQLSELYATTLTDTIPPDPDEVRILHISDVHLNPLGIEVAEDLADRFDVAAVVDTGDLTTFGLPAEAAFGGQIDGFGGIPYLLVPGNHDSTANRGALDAVDGVVLLDGETYTVGGVRILGVGDPTFTAENDLSRDDANHEIDAQAAETAALVDEERPDVLAVHNPRQAEDSLGAVPLVIAGHTHERSETEEDGTVVLTVGSTGATGLGSFTVADDPQYEAEVLRFVDGTLVGVDYLTLSGVAGEFTIDRTLVEGDGS